MDRILYGATLAAKLAWAPIQDPQRVQDCAPNAELRVTLELHLLVVVELAERVNQTYDASRDEIVQLHMLRQTLMNTMGEIAHRGKVFEQKTLVPRALYRRRGSRLG